MPVLRLLFACENNMFASIMLPALLAISTSAVASIEIVSVPEPIRYEVTSTFVKQLSYVDPPAFPVLQLPTVCPFTLMCEMYSEGESKSVE
jgi:hypothetical protein